MRGGIAYALTGGRVRVTARSKLHDTDTLWKTLSGTVRVDPADPAAGAEAEITVDMRDLDAGDRLKNWKLRSDLEPDRHPFAIFRLSGLEDVTAAGGEARWRAVAVGSIEWRGRTAPIRAAGSGLITAARIEAEATFDLDVRVLGVTPPKILMFKVEPEVQVTVRLEATAR